jgi:cation transport regulator
MPYNSTDELPDGVKKNLPAHAQSIYMSAFNSALDGTCKDSSDKEACASKVAWSAVKNSYEKGEDGSWNKKSELHELSMYITKAVKDEKTGEMTWSAVASDTDKDYYEQAMSKELFQDFITRANNKDLVPELFRSEYWQGGMPYVSVSHYPDFDGEWSAGETKQLFIDGDKLKAKGIFYDTPLGMSCFEAVRKSVKEDVSEKVRISIAFLDWKHRHDNMVFIRESLSSHCPMCEKSQENVVFLKGQLIHLALTRVPANSRTSIDAEVTKAMAHTQKEDAESIVGTEMAEKLEEKASLIQRSEAIVIKSEDAQTEEVTPTETVVAEVTETAPDAPVVAVIEEAKKPEKEEPKEDDEALEDDEDLDEDGKKKKVNKSTLAEEMRSFMERIEKAVTPVTALESVSYEAHPLDEALNIIKSSYDIIMKSTVSEDEKLMSFQEPMDNLGAVIKASVKDTVSNPTVEAKSSEATKDDIQEIVSRSIQEALQPIVESISLLSQQKSMGQDAYRPSVPTPRSINPSLIARTKVSVKQSETPKIRKLIEATVKGQGLPRL